MSPLALTSIEIVPRVLQLVVGLLGLIFSIKGRSRGVSGLMVAAFVVMLATTAAGIAWQFVSLNAPSWSRAGHLGIDDIQLIFLAVGIPLDTAAVLSWLLVALAVVKGSRMPRPYPGPVGYPMAAQPGFVSPQPGYAQPGYPQPGPQSPQPPG